MFVRAAYTAILCAFITVQVHGKSVPPKMRRVCLDRINSTATLYWTAPVDTCSTFSGYRIWGRDDVNGSFVSMGTETQRNTLTKTVSIPNLKRWQFYIVASFTCGSLDSLISDTLLVDDSEPVPMDLDSVSVDMATQRIIAGWQKNGSTDLQGYLLYKVSATNQIIADTNSTQYLFSGLNSRSTGNRVAISAYDSCLQAGLISSYHEPVLLSATDSIYCKNLFSFRFSPYVGWAALKYEVYFKPQGSIAFTKHVTIPNTGPFSFNITVPLKNTKYQCFVRVFHTNGLTTSTSNLMTFGFDSFPSHTYSYIRRVTQKNENIMVHAVFDNPNGSIKNASIQYSQNGFTWNTLTTSSTSPINLTTDNSANLIKYFRVSLTGRCNEQILTSNTSNNIILQEFTNSEFTYSWNPYASWPLGVKEYQILIGNSNNDVSTWNSYAFFPTTPPTYKLPENFPKDQCICVLAIERGPNALGYTDSSYSNVICPYEISDVYIPSAFTPNNDGKNEVFTALSPALDSDKSTITIYNRWGSKIHTGPLRAGWNGYDQSMARNPLGAYVYVIDAVSKSGVRKIYQGTVTLIY